MMRQLSFESAKRRTNLPQGGSRFDNAIICAQINSSTVRGASMVAMLHCLIFRKDAMACTEAVELA